MIVTIVRLGLLVSVGATPARRLTGRRLFDNRRGEASRDGHSDRAHAPLPADIYSSTVQLGALGRNRGGNGESSGPPRFPPSTRRRYEVGSAAEESRARQLLTPWSGQRSAAAFSRAKPESIAPLRVRSDRSRKIRATRPSHDSCHAPLFGRYRRHHFPVGSYVRGSWTEPKHSPGPGTEFFHAGTPPPLCNKSGDQPGDIAFGNSP